MNLVQKYFAQWIKVSQKFLWLSYDNVISFQSLRIIIIILDSFAINNSFIEWTHFQWLVIKLFDSFEKQPNAQTKINRSRIIRLNSNFNLIHIMAIDHSEYNSFWWWTKHSDCTWNMIERINYIYISNHIREYCNKWTFFL